MRVNSQFNYFIREYIDRRAATAADKAGAGTVVAGEIPQEPAAFQQRAGLLEELRAAGPGVTVVRAVTGMLGLDQRTERSLREAIESYRRGVFLAASSLLGAAVEGAWYAAGQRLRATVPQVGALVDGDRTAQLQGAVAAALRDSLPGNRRWEADGLSQFARLMRDIRNYGVHPRQVTGGDIEVCFAEDKCGLLFLEARRHLKHLARVTDQALRAG